MKKAVKIGIIICERYSSCAAGKCFRALAERTGGFSIYKNMQVELGGYTSCGGCPGGNIEDAPEEMKNNGVSIVHFATGMVVGYPPCPFINHYKKFIEIKYGLKVVIGTHPIPEKYYQTHMRLKTWNTPVWKKFIKPSLSDKKTRLSYN